MSWSALESGQERGYGGGSQMANLLTALRIVCGIAILTCPVFSAWYYALYLLAGLTDAIDGTVAGKLGESSAFGARFDTFADIVFALAVTIRLAASIVIPSWVLCWIVLIAAMKAISIVTGFWKYNRFVTVHSMMNKGCGVIVFLLPLLVGSDYVWQLKALGVVIAGIVASAAAINEFFCILKGKGAA